LAAAAQVASAGAAVPTGEGDIELPGDAQPVPARAPEPIAAADPPEAPSGWSIQVGAFATRAATEQAIHAAVSRAPSLLGHAKALVATLHHGKGTLYRARLTGLDASDARKACRVLDHCQALPPGAS
jgi:D-alanyl-D-alanine carboxypeptidase